MGNNPSVKDFFNVMAKCYTQKGFIYSVHEALQDLRPFPNAMIDPFEDQEQRKK